MKKFRLQWVFTLGSVLALATGLGQGKRPEPATAQLRVWKGDFLSKRTIKLTLRGSGRKGAATEIAPRMEGYYFSEYSQLPAGSVTLEVSDEQNAKSKLTSITASLDPGSFATLILGEIGGQVSMELINDNAPTSSRRELRVRNFVAHLSPVQIDAGEDLHARLVGPDAFLNVRGVAQKKVQVRTSGMDASGKSFQWSNEIDFTQFPRVTILIYPDNYGRIRPRIVVDGQFLDQSPPDGEAPKKVP
jgi:hypothetical protein